MKWITVGVATLLALTTGCGTRVPVTDISEVPEERMQQAYQIDVYTVDSNKDHPPISKYIGDVTAYSCKYLISDPPASKGDALAQLRLKALDADADAVINVTFDASGTDAWGTNCWESVQANGIAVQFEK